MIAQFESRIRAAVLVAALAIASALSLGAQTSPAADYLYNDSHFHLTNYVQEGTDVRDYVRDDGRHGRARRRCSGFRCSRCGRTATPATSLRTTTCRPTRRSTTTRSPTRTSRWRTARSLRQQQARFDPMITGFNPADMYAADHIRRVLLTFPGVFSGHRRVHDPQGVRLREDRRADRPRLTDPALAPHPRFRGRGRPGRDPAQRRRHAVPKTGPGAVPPASAARSPDQAPGCDGDLGPCRSWGASCVRSTASSMLLDRALASPALRNLHIDISWDETAKYITSSPEALHENRGAHQQVSGPVPFRLGRRGSRKHRFADGGLQHVCSAVESCSPRRRAGR